VALAAFWPGRGAVLDWFEPNPARNDISVGSADVSADVRLMWETRPRRGTPDPSYGPNPRSSTDRAINAASRVFNTVELVGKTPEEVIALLGDPKTSSDSIYNFPFWPPPEGRSLIYRFDSGSYGWQFNVRFGEDDRVCEVQRHWIH
jgi:hypothetical protein